MEKNKIIKWFNKLELDICLLCKDRTSDGGCGNESSNYLFYNTRVRDLNIRSCDSIKIKHG